MSPCSRPFRHTLTLALVAILGILTLTACTPTPSFSQSLTLVSTSTSAEPLPTIPKGLEFELVSMASQAKKPGDAVVRILTTANPTVVSERDIAPVRGQEVEHGAARERKIRENIDALKADLAAAVSRAPGLDLVRLLDAASLYPESRIIVLSSALNTAAPADITPFGWNFDPEAVAESVHRQGLLNLDRKDVTYFGIGATGGSVQPRLPPYARKLLEELWIAICQKSGAASCAIGNGEPSTAEPRSTLPVPIVPVPAAHTDGDGCPVWQRLDDAALPFDANSAVLRISADALLQPVVDAAIRCRISHIVVEGHIADTGSGSDPTNLSGRRAQVVADRLLVLGLPPHILGTVTGRGASTPVVPNLTPDGQFIESAAVQNRRVEIFLTR